jgi:hypothetical protein
VLDKIVLRLEPNSAPKNKGVLLVRHLQKQSKPTEKFSPLYEADQGPLSQRQLAQIKQGAPKLIGAVVRSCLFREK